jgi:hypothetical protein
MHHPPLETYLSQPRKITSYTSLQHVSRFDILKLKRNRHPSPHEPTSQRVRMEKLLSHPQIPGLVSHLQIFYQVRLHQRLRFHGDEDYVGQQVLDHCLERMREVEFKSRIW